MRKLNKKGFDHKTPLTSIHSPWKKGNYKGNYNYFKYKQHQRSLQDDIIPDTLSLMDSYLANSGTITKCPTRTT